jgi:hypothetical protein
MNDPSGRTSVQARNGCVLCAGPGCADRLYPGRWPGAGVSSALATEAVMKVAPLERPGADRAAVMIRN